MANPFLVLGGIAISVITAAFGVLAVPGWVASAQDAAASNDVAQVSAAQTAALSEHGTYLGSLADLNAQASVRVSTSGGVRLVTSTDPSGSHLLTVARSLSGTYFARVGGKATIGQHRTLEGAVTATGTTVTGPADARVTGDGVPLPKPGELSAPVMENLFRNANATTTLGFGVHWGVVGAGTIQSVPASWTYSGTAVRFTQTVDPVDNRPHFDLRPAAWMEPGKRYTFVWDVVGPGTHTLSGRVAGYPELRTAVAGSNQPGKVIDSTPTRVWATFDTPATIPSNWQAYMSLNPIQKPGDWVEFGNVQMYEGDYDPDRPWFSGDKTASTDIGVSWQGNPNSSISIAYQ